MQALLDISILVGVSLAGTLIGWGWHRLHKRRQRKDFEEGLVIMARNYVRTRETIQDRLFKGLFDD